MAITRSPKSAYGVVLHKDGDKIGGMPLYFIGMRLENKYTTPVNLNGKKVGDAKIYQGEKNVIANIDFIEGVEPTVMNLFPAMCGTVKATDEATNEITLFELQEVSLVAAPLYDGHKNLDSSHTHHKFKTEVVVIVNECKKKGWEWRRIKRHIKNKYGIELTK